MDHYRGTGRHFRTGGLFLDGEDGLRCAYGSFDGPLPAPTAADPFRLRSADHHRTQDQLPDIQPPGAGRLCRQRSADAGRLFHRRHDQRRRPLDSARSFPVPAFGSTQGRHRTVSGPAARRPAERDRQITDHPLAQPAAVEAPRPAQNLARGHVAHPGPRPALLCSDLPGPHLVGRAGLLRLVGDDAYRTGEDR